MQVKEQGVFSKKLRLGYTTGTAAAAAAKAAAIMLLTKNVINKISVETPSGVTLTLKVLEQEIVESEASCCVVKNAGDDPDVTNGMKIYARVREGENGIAVKGGEGIGVVTKPGLSLPVGAPAINPVPLKMIKCGVEEVLPFKKGFEIIISAPEGSERAKKTFNPKLGVEGGISILGTTGIVKPMSNDSWKFSLLPQIDIAKAAGFKNLVLTPGNMGERVAIRLGIRAEAIVQMSNFVGFMLKACADRKIEKVLLLGHVGKLAKVAQGNFNTHSKVTPLRLELIRSIAIDQGASTRVISEIKQTKTAEEITFILRAENLDKVLCELARRVSQKASQYVNHRLVVGTALSNLAGEIVGFDDQGKLVLEENN